MIEDCRITGWGRVGGPKTFGNPGNQDSAIYAEDGSRNLVVQRNLIEHPRGAANDWSTGHPSGPQAITINESGGGQNFSTVGNLNRDSDVYGNYVRNVWDDALEVEGSNTNIRIWGNYLHKTVQHIATASTTHGPIYIFRNVFGESRWGHDNPAGAYLLKVGGRGEFDGGRRFVFHNTSVQPRGGMHVFSGHSDPNALSRNNVWDVNGMLNRNLSAAETPKSDFDYDLYTGLSAGLPTMSHRVRTSPRLVESQKLEFYPSTWTTSTDPGRKDFVRAGKKFTVTDPLVTRLNLMIDGGVPIPNFNDDWAGTAPDIGAFEAGRPPLPFGREGIGAPRAPWE